MSSLIDIQKSRKEKAINLLDKLEHDAWLVISDGNDPNLEYLIGVKTYSTTVALLTRDELKVLVSSLEESMVQLEHIDEVKTFYGISEFLKEFTNLLSTIKKGKVFINNSSPLILSHSAKMLSGHEKIVKNLSALFDISLHPSDKLVYELRSQKTKEEANALRIAVEETVKIIEDVIENHAKVGMTEKQLSAELYKQIYGIGYPAFENIVAFGVNTANPHHLTSDKKLREGEVAYIDAGVKILGMCGDITRVFFAGQPNKEEKEVYRIVKEAQDQAINELKPGVDPKEPDKTARRVFEEAGYDPKLFSHGLGHPIGLEVHDVGPVLSWVYKGEDKIRQNMILTVEPALYFKEKWGIRLEDDVIITENGHLRLSRTPEEGYVI